MTSIKARITKLPKWAQEYIADLERKIQSQEIDIMYFRTREEPTSVYCSTGKFYLPEGSSVEFTVPDQKYRVHLQNENLHVYSEKPLAVAPRAANHVRIL